MVFYITFPQYHPLRDNWIEIEAEDKETVRRAAFVLFGDKFAFLYTTEDFNATYYSDGKVGRTVIAENLSFMESDQ